MLRVITPRTQNRFVDLICSQILPGAIPVRVPVTPEPSAKLNECFLNITDRIMRDGGCARNGWCIWELPGLFIETECHGVWVDPAGQSLDITPKENNAQEILFLPDPSVVFDEKSLVRRDNIRMAIKDHPIVHSFLKSSVDYVKYLESCTDPANPRLMRVDPHVQAELLLRKARLQLEMQKLPVGRNDTCRCGSGQKYKKCCGR